MFALCASAETVSGTCGASGNEANVTWSFDTETGHLTISGTGETASYGENAAGRPWNSYTEDIKSATIENGITVLGQRLFTGTSITSIVIPDSVTTLKDFVFSTCRSLTDVTIGSGVTSIGQYAFSGCSALESITIPGNVKTLSNHVFNICSKLKSITLEEGISTIGGSCFYQCTGLTEVVLPFSVTKIGANSSAFAMCTNLTDVTFLSPSTVISPASADALPASSVTIHGLAESTAEAHAAAYGHSFVAIAPTILASGTCGTNVTWELTSDGTLTLSGTGNMADYSTIDAVPWYSYRRSIKAISIGDAITSIGNRAFNECAITEIVIPDSVQSIGYNGFRGCSSLKSVSIGSGVVTLSTYAFQICSALTEIVIPGNVKTIGSNAFAGCTKLSSVTIEEGVLKILGLAFSNCSALTELVIPSTVLEIGSTTASIFDANCTALTDVTILSHITKIARANADAFPAGVTIHAPANSTAATFATEYGHNFEAITVYHGICGATGNEANVTWRFDPETGTLTISGTGSTVSYNTSYEQQPWLPFAGSITKIVVEEGIKTLGNRIFMNLAAATEISLPDGLTTIGQYAIKQCHGLKSIIIPDTVTTMSYQAMNNCDGLTSIVIPASVKTLGNEVFNGSGKLTHVIFLSTDAVCGTTKAIFSAGIANIYCYPGSTIEAHAATYGITTRPMVSTGDCSADGSSVSWSFDVLTGTLTISGSGAMADYDNTGKTDPWNDHTPLIKHLVVESGVKTLGAYAFMSTPIETATFPSDLENIRKYAFSSCSSLDNLTIPGSVTLYDSCFANCSALTNLVLEEGIQSITARVFANCTSLKNVVLPSTVTSIGGNLTAPFNGCNGLESITFLNKNVKIYPADPRAEGDNIFPIPFAVKLLAPAGGTVETYANTYNYAFEAIEIDTSLGKGECGENLTWKVSEDGILTIRGTGAMNSYTKEPNAPWYSLVNDITKIVIEEGVTTIGDFAFNSLKSVTEVTFPSTLTLIGKNAFRYCHALTTVNFAENGAPLMLDEYAFNQCKILTSITIPSYVTEIKSYAFTQCGLTDVTIHEGVSYISSAVFNSCASLETITIPASVLRLGYGTSSAFTNTMTNFKSITLLSGDTDLRGTLPAGTTITITAPAGGAVEKYAMDNGYTFIPLGGSTPEPDEPENPFTGNDCTTVFELTAGALKATAGHFLPLATIERGSASVCFLYVDENGALHLETADGAKHAMFDQNGNAIVLAEGTSLTVVYDDETGLARFYVNKMIPLYGTEKTPAVNVAVADEAFTDATAQNDNLKLADGVTAEAPFAVNTVPAEFAGFQIGTDHTKIRILAGVDMLYYDGIGFEVSLYSNGILQGTITSMANTVFTTIQAAGDPVTAEECGFEYLAALVIENIDRTEYPSDAVVYFTVKTFATIGDNKLYGAEKTIGITYDAEKQTHVYTLGLPPVNEPGEIVLRFIAGSDVHITDSLFNDDGTVKSTAGAGKLQSAINQIAAYFADPANNGGHAGIDAVALAGDIVNTGTDQQYQNAETFFASAIPEGTELVITMGNHDWGNDSALTYEDALVYRDKFEAVFGPATRDVVIGGYHFITINCDERLDAKGDNGANMKRPYGYDFSEATVAEATRLIEAAVADDPTKPVFVIQHVANSDTIGGSLETVTKADGSTLKGDTSDSAVPTLLELQSKYPNLIVFSGHSHFPTNDVASIHQKYFTSLNTGVLGGSAGQSRVGGNKFSDMTADPNINYAHGNNDDVFVIEVDSNNHVTIRVWNGASNSFIGETWIVDSFNPDEFRYTEDRFSNDDIFFADGAAITEELVASNAISVTFPSVAAESVEARVYKLVATSSVTGNKTVGYVIPEYYNIDEPITLSATLSGLEPNTKYTLEITALNPLYSYDIASGGTIVSDSLTMTFTTRREGGPDLIQFEIDVKENALKNLVPAGLAPDTSITPNTYFDASIGMNVVAFDGTVESAIRFANYGDAGFCDTIADGMTLEAYLRVDEIPTSSFAGLIASVQNSGGFGLFVTSEGKLGLRYNNGESGSTADERWLYHPISAGTYYHVAVVYDGAGTLTLYVNGVAVASDNTITRFRVPDSNYSRRFYMGADVLNSTTCQSPSKCTIANFGLYSTPLTAEKIMASYKSFRVLAPKTPDVINVSYDVKNQSISNTVGSLVPTNVGTPVFSYDASIGMNVANFVSNGNPDSAGNNLVRFDLDAANDILVDGMTFETYLKIDVMPTETDKYFVPIGAMHNGGFGLRAHPDGTMEFGYYDTVAKNYLYISFPYVANKYYHIVAVYDGATYTLYVDGESVGSVGMSSFALPSNTSYRKCIMGADAYIASSSRNSATCTIATFNLYSEPLSAKNVADAYAKLPKDDAVILEMTETSANEGGTYGDFNVYVKTSDPSGAYYVRYHFDHAYNTTATGEADSGNDLDMFRIQGAELVKVTGIGNTSVTYQTITKVLQTGEIALAIKEDGAVDFVGGFHGDEHFAKDTEGNDLFAIYANGVRHYPGQANQVIICKALTIEQKTVLDRCNTDVAVMTHNQTYSITSSGISVRREVEWLVDDFTLLTTDGYANSYLQLFTMYRTVDGNKVCEIVETYDANGNRIGGENIDHEIASEYQTLRSENAVSAKYSSATSGISAQAGFTVIDDSVDANAAWIKVRKDATGDSKWYASFSSVENGTTPKTGEVWAIDAFYHIDYVAPIQ